MSQIDSNQPERTAKARASLLVVDDDPLGRKVLTALLQAEGHHVRCAEDGPTALAAVEQELPDLVLLDVMMPGMTGFEVCEILKSEPRTRLCQVMLVTALDGTPDKVSGLDTGADDYCTKPVRREEFLAKVRALLRVRRILSELEDARADLAARNSELELKKTLAQTLVHDLKNPLSAVLGNLDLLEMRADEPLHPLILRSKQGAVRMLKMILNLLDVERLDHGHLEPTCEPLCAAEIVGAAVDEAEAGCTLRQVELEYEIDSTATIHADRVLIRRVVDNVLSNAIHHSPVGGRIDVTVCGAADRVRIAVSDQGPGIPEEYREQVFDKYAQAELRKNGVSSNRGLGLTFCRLAVEAHGGRIWIEEAPQGGARVQVELPATVPPKRVGGGLALSA